MKTSNKLLLALIAIIFAVPLLLAFALKNKIKRGEYTVQKNNYSRNEKYMRSGSVPPVKVVSVISAHPDFLTCHLIQSDGMSYKYYKDDNDSITVSTSNDTLYIRYLKQETNSEQDKRDIYRHLEIDVNLPTVASVLVDGSVVVLHSSTLKDLPVTLKNNGVIRNKTPTEKTKGVKETSFTEIKNDKSSQVPGTYTAKTATLEAFEKKKNSMPEITYRDVRELLIFSLLYRII